MELGTYFRTRRESGLIDNLMTDFPLLAVGDEDPLHQTGERARTLDDRGDVVVDLFVIKVSERHRHSELIGTSEGRSCFIAQIERGWQLTLAFDRFDKPKL